SAPVVLGPPGGSPGSNQCSVAFTVTTLKTPTIDVDPAPGTQTWANLLAKVTSSGGLMVTSGPSLKITVARGNPGISTSASGTVVQGGAISDTATVTGVGNAATPTGTVTFKVYGPNDANCTGAVFGQSTTALAGGVSG